MRGSFVEQTQDSMQGARLFLPPVLEWMDGNDKLQNVRDFKNKFFLSHLVVQGGVPQHFF